MKIYFRYLFMRLFQMFALVLAAMALIWIMVDLYGNIEDFFENKAQLSTVLRFYIWNIPKMLVLVLPAALLFSMLFTLLTLNRRSELVAFQAGGLAPLVMFSPFFLFTLICVAVLAYDMQGPAATAEVTRERLLKQIKGDAAGRDSINNVIGVDGIHHRAYYISKLDLRDGTAKGMVITDMNDQWQDMLVYAANAAKFTGDSWQLSDGVAKITYGPGDIAEQPKIFDSINYDDETTPNQLALEQSQPEEMTVPQLERYIAAEPESMRLPIFRTEWWYRLLYPLCLPVLMLFALRQGAQNDRRNALGGVLLSIFAFFGFMILLHVLMAVSQHGHMAPWLAVGSAELLFGLIGLHLMALKSGWYWQLGQWMKRKKPSPSR